MDKSNFLKVLNKYLQGHASTEECEFILHYYSLFETEPDVVALMSEEQKQQLKNEMYASISENIRSKEIQKFNNAEYQYNKEKGTVFIYGKK